MTRAREIRFMDNQLLGSTDRMSYSSALSAYPGANVFDPLRSRVWKPAGNFEVTAARQLIYVNDGADKTVTLTVGFYTYSTLAAHIQTQLNASSSNWTCTYDFVGGTFKFTIARSSGTAVLRLSQTTSAAWDMLGYTYTSDQITTPFVAQEQRNHTDEWVKVDLVQAREILFAGLIGPLGQKFSVSHNGVVSIQGNGIDLWTAPPLDQPMDISDLGALLFIDDIADTIYRWARLRIVDRLNPVGPEGFSFGFGYIGDYRAPTGTNISQGFLRARVDPSVVQKSDSGVEYGLRRTKFRAFRSMVLDNMPKADVQKMDQLYEDLGILGSFFVSIDPTLTVSDSLDDMTFYGRFDGDPALDHVARSYYRHELGLREAV